MCANKIPGLFFVAISLFNFVLIQECYSACQGLTCDECISDRYSCAWCSEKNFTFARCGIASDLQDAGCKASSIENPSTTQTDKKLAEDVRDSKGNKRAIQIHPQHIKIKARPRYKTTTGLTFRAADKYPVDLYFLFDVSFTMRPALDNLRKLADDIGEAIGNISSNYHLGYGVFQDKVILPFTDTTPKRLKNPCFMKRHFTEKCDQPFEYKHLLSMTQDIKKFKDIIDNTKLTANNDFPEGSLDAMMQAITCKSEIGWRKIGRKILIFASDAPFHTAGAGRLAGIVDPNDGQCHLNSKGGYDKELMQDYPSVSQITTTVKNHEMHVIFIVDSTYKDLFSQLSSRIPQSTVGTLGDPKDPDNQNIKNTIEKKYKEMISEVEIVHNNPAGVDIKIKAVSDECEQMGTNICKGLQIGSKIDFIIEITIKECPPKGEDRKRNIIFYPKSLKNDQLLVELEMICECDCSNDQTAWETSPDVCTSGNGTLICGVCDCKNERSGSECECDSTNFDSTDSLENLCIKKDDKSTFPCSDHGLCECGRCKCEEGYTGKYCECNDKSCKSYQRQVCGGIRGVCRCGSCVCEEGYTGEACECSTSNATCIQDGVLCSDRGYCECSMCKCNPGYTGTLCQDCFLCGACNEYRKCAACVQEAGHIADCQTLDCPEMELVDNLLDAGCSLKQSDDCFLKFTTTLHEKNVTLHVQRTKTCPQPVNIIPIVAGAIAGVVAVGVFLLILWKILTTLFDKIEYSKFQEDLKHCKWAKEDNPVYNPATRFYKNPMVDTNEPQD